MTEHVQNGEPIICLRTQNPRMYRALEKHCSSVYPNSNEDIPDAIRAEFARYLGSEIDDRGVVRRHYGGLFYGEEPTYDRVSDFFKEELGMDLYRGDAMLAIGVR